MTKEIARKPGRPKGSKNTLTLLQESAVEGVMTEVLKDFDKIVKTTIKKAQDGDTVCLKILWDRVVPAKKAVENQQPPGSGGVTIVVNSIESIKTNHDITDAEYEEIPNEKQ